MSSKVDLSTTYMGLQLKNPIVPSASPLSKDIDTAKELEDFGASAIVVYSLFEEQVAHEAQELSHFLDHGTETFAEALSYFPEPDEYHTGPDEYLEHIRKLKQTVDIPIIGSLNGSSVGGWIDYARSIEDAGADALELNVYYIPADTEVSGREVEDTYIEILKELKTKVKIPIAIKLSPYFSSIGHISKRLDEDGADGLVLFNRFYQPDIDLENLEVYPNLQLSTSQDMRLPLRWIAILHGRVGASLAATTGIHTSEDVVKMLLAGADVTQVCSTLLRHGVRRLEDILQNLRIWMEEHEYASVDEMRGSMSHRSTSDPSAFERANYMRALNTYS